MSDKRVINNKIPIIPRHKYGCDASISISTDLFDSFVNCAELACFKFNQKLTIHSGFYEDLVLTNRTESVNSGKIDVGVWMAPGIWRDPTVPGEINPATPTAWIKSIPDYAATTWTSAGVAVFRGAVLGAAKTQYYPNHGQEMYDISLGDYGYDFVNNISGLSNQLEWLSMMDFRQTYFQNLFGRKFSIMSHGLYVKFYNNVLQDKVLYGRTTVNQGTSQAFFDYSRFFDKQKNIIRYDINRDGILRYDVSADYISSSLSYIETQIGITITNSGFFQAFQHLRSTTRDIIYGVISTMNTACGSNNVARISVRQAIEHFFIRQCIRITKYTDLNGIQLGFQFYKISIKDFDETLITEKISLNLDTTGTSMENLDIQCDNPNVDIIKNSSNHFLLEIPIVSFTNEFLINITSTLSPTYKTFSAPSLISAIISDTTTLTVTSDINTKCVLFVVARGGNNYDATMLSRSNNFGTSHVFTVSTSDQAKDIYIGLINEMGTSILSTAYQFL
jgi:hypothetical protein